MQHPKTPHVEASEAVEIFEATLAGGRRLDVLRHLLRGCSDCRETLSTEATTRSTPLADFFYEMPVRRAERKAIESWKPAFERATQEVNWLNQGREEFEAPAPLPDDILRRARADTCLGQARSLRRGDPEAYHEAALLAVLFAEPFRDIETPNLRAEPSRNATGSTFAGPPPRTDTERVALCAWAELANAERIEGDLNAAGAAFGEVERRLAGTNLIGEDLAEAIGLYATWLIANRQFAEAEKILVRASCACEGGKLLHEAGTLASLAAIAAAQQGRLTAAIVRTKRAIELIDPRRDAELLFAGYQNVAEWTAELGDLDAAEALALGARQIAELTGLGRDVLKVRWFQARLARRGGRIAVAEIELRAVRNEFEALKLPFRAALVALDLADLYLQSGRFAEVGSLAADLVQTFAALGIQRETYASLALLAEAARQGAATTALLEAAAGEVRALRPKRPTPETLRP